MRNALTDPTRILLLDDHPAILDGLAAFLESHDGLHVVGRFPEPRQALAGLLDARPEVAVVDIKVGGGFSFEFVEEAKRRLPELKLVFITGHDDDVFLEKAFEVGGLGFVLKSEPLDELVQAVRSVVKGERYVSAEARRRFGGGDGTTVSSRLALLTPREREVLKYVSQGMSAKEISKILNISTWTVTNHKANIMAKLDIHNQVGLARFAVATGLANNL